jgi:hypothetical protein
MAFQFETSQSDTHTHTHTHYVMQIVYSAEKGDRESRESFQLS